MSKKGSGMDSSARSVVHGPFSERDWTWTNIFKPLGMTRTLFRDNYRETVEDRAYSINYHPREGFLRGEDNLSAVGSLGLFTTLDDFVKWVQNLDNPVVGSARVKDMMTASGALADGREAGHSYGLNGDTYNLNGDVPQSTTLRKLTLICSWLNTYKNH